MNRRRLFGTSGIRGVINRDLSPDFCRRVALAIGTTLPQSSAVCIATDTRISREVIKEAITAGLLSCGINVVDLGILPTPALALLTRELGFAAGIMVTASHNPPEFNGIKLFTDNSLGYSQPQEEEVERIYFEQRFRQGKKGTLEQGQDMMQRYLSFIKGKLTSTGFKQQPSVGGGDDGGRFPEGKLSSPRFKQQPSVGGGCSYRRSWPAPKKFNGSLYHVTDETLFHVEQGHTLTLKRHEISPACRRQQGLYAQALNTKEYLEPVFPVQLCRQVIYLENRVVTRCSDEVFELCQTKCDRHQLSLSA